MTEITLHTGSIGDVNTIYIAWANENNVPQSETLEIIVPLQDKPRILEVRLNGKTIATVQAKEQKTFEELQREADRRVHGVALPGDEHYKMTASTALNTEPEKFFLRLAEESGKVTRNHFSWCYQGHSCKVRPDPENPHRWTIEFDPSKGAEDA